VRVNTAFLSSFTSYSLSEIMHVFYPHLLDYALFACLSWSSSSVKVSRLVLERTF